MKLLFKKDKTKTMEYYTSDWHLGDDRIGIKGKPNLFYRPFSSVKEQDNTIIENFTRIFRDGDTLNYLGDLFVNDRANARAYLENLRKTFPNSKFNLIVGNYDEKELNFLSSYFDTIENTSFFKFTEFDDDGRFKEYKVVLNHYPIKCKSIMENLNDVDFAITGHIHGLWKVQKNMINVGVDAWNFRPVPFEEIKFCWNAMQKFYDENVFPY